MSRILIIDASNFNYRAYFSYRRMQNKGKSVSCIYGTPSIITGMLKKLKPDKVYLCWDGKRHARRLELLPEYKGKRKKLGVDMEDLFAQKEVLYEMFNALGIQQILNPKMEADDMIYYLVKKYRKTNEVIIASGDKDFHQLISTNVKVWDDGKGLMLDKSNLKKFFGYRPDQCVDYLTLVGDSSDNIPGYRGIGPKKALEFLKNHSILEYLERSIKKIPDFKGIDYEKLVEIHRTNSEVIGLKMFYDLNLKGNKPIKYYKGENPVKFKKKKFLAICRKHSLMLFQKDNFIKIYKRLWQKNLE